MTNQASLNGLMETYVDSFCAFTFIDNNRPDGPAVSDNVDRNNWLRALRGARTNAKERLVMYIVELFLDKAAPTARSGESGIFVSGTALRTCLNQAAAGRLLRQARLLSHSGESLDWLVTAVTNEMHTHEHFPPLKATIVSVFSIDSLQIVPVHADSNSVSVS